MFVSRHTLAEACFSLLWAVFDTYGRPNALYANALATVKTEQVLLELGALLAGQFILFFAYCELIRSEAEVRSSFETQLRISNNSPLG